MDGTVFTVIALFKTVFTAFMVFIRFSMQCSTRVKLGRRQAVLAWPCGTLVSTEHGARFAARACPSHARAVLATRRRKKVPNEPCGVQSACRGSYTRCARGRSAPRRAPLLAMPRRRLLQYPGSSEKTVNTVNTAVKTDCKTHENRENRYMLLKKRIQVSFL